MTNEQKIKNMTNEQKIKNMSAEELARGIKFLLTGCLDCPAYIACVNTLEDKTCFEKIEEWLKEEAEE